ncbi:ATP-grasp domain-containing protein [Mesorhizobium sp. B2-6-5]|uniref:ATP-grasp domain-containing protein n=1 Tax=Mesorhizobium sp. B2-6-5 TaxID=2589912 RepID=UPI0015E28DB1|nr:ATP-grasp domain-containing protein [Mesorhizobium sp. B2-6-5]
MKLTEDVAKELLRKRGLPVPQGTVATTASVAAIAAKGYGGAVAVKALIAAGRRGKAGLVRLAETEELASQAAADLLGIKAMGGKVERLYVERQVDIGRELYLSFAFADRTLRMVLSCQGGVDIEALHAASPEKILVVDIDAVRGLKPWDAIAHWSGAGLTGRPLAAVGRLTAQLYNAFVAS